MSHTTRVAGIALLLALRSVAFAQPADTVEAGKRFSAGVALYNEADYAAALVEFKRAYAIAPSPLVLYNIGQTHYQLQDYAAAYLTLTQFLRESDGKADHRSEVEQTITLLQSRIGKIDVSTDVEGAEVVIDDTTVGKTPLQAPVLVSVGRRRVSVTAPGRQPWNRVIDVAAGDTVRQEITLQSLEIRTVTGKGDGKSVVLPALWVSTGVLAAGAITFGVLAWRASSDLSDLRDTYPVDRADLDDKSDKVALYSYLSDGLTVATVAVGVTALVLTLKRGKTDTKERAQVGVGPRGVVVGGTF